MPKILFVCLFSTLLCAGFSASAASVKDSMALVAAVESLRVAMESGQAEALSAIVSEDLSYGHSGGAIENKLAFIEKFVAGKSVFSQLVFADLWINVNGKSALVRHVLTANTLDKGVAGKIQLKVLLVWKMEKGKWRLWARQAIKLA